MKILPHTPLKFAALALVGLLLAVTSSSAQLPPPSPVGAWDCTISGKDLGQAIIRFDADFTFTGTQLIRPSRPGSASLPPVDPRHPGGEPGRNGVSSSVPSGSATTTNFVGGNDLMGRWSHDTAGRVIGLLDQVSATVQLVEKSVTNVVDGTNMVSLTNVYEQVLETNAVSFRATVVEGSRLTLVSFQPRGQNIYRGLPSITLTDISGGSYGDGKRAGSQFFEFLSAMPTGDFENEYFLDGAGAGYSYTGFAIVSRHRRIAVYTETRSLPAVVTVYSGAFDLTTRRGYLYGRDTNGKNYTYRLVHQ